MPYCPMIRALPAVVMLIRWKGQKAVIAINKQTICQAVRLAGRVIGLIVSGSIGWLDMGVHLDLREQLAAGIEELLRRDRTAERGTAATARGSRCLFSCR